MTDVLIDTLAASLLRSSAMLLLAWLALRAVATARARHAIWTVAVIGALALPFGLAFLPRATILLPSAAFPTWWQSSHKALPQVISASSPRAIRQVSGFPFVEDDSVLLVSPDWKAIVLMVWAAGALALVLRLLVSVVSAARIVRRARRLAPPHLGALADEIVARHRWRITVRLLESDDVSSPATVGWLRPAILLPASATLWDSSRALAILTHELAHVARRDCLTQQLAQLASALYWMNPLIWLAERRMAAERERACDDIVLASGTAPHSYARLLVEMLRLSPNPRARAVLSMAHPSQLETRLALILAPARSHGELATGKWLSIVVAAAAAVVAITVVNPSAASARARQTAPPSAEPDRLGDSVASPRSERVQAPETVDPDLVRAALAGPDSLLARALVAALDRVPSWEGDLVRARAAWAISLTRDGRLVEPLIEALDAHDWRVRAYAAWALAPARDPRAVPALVRALGHPVWRVRAMAAHSLSESPDPRVRDAMLRALEDVAWQVRFSAVTYLGKVGGVDAERFLRPRLEDRHIGVRTAARSALSPRAGSPE